MAEYTASSFTRSAKADFPLNLAWYSCMHGLTMAEERVARALRHLNNDASFLSATDSVLELIEGYFDSDVTSNPTPLPHYALYSIVHA